MEETGNPFETQIRHYKSQISDLKKKLHQMEQVELSLQNKEKERKRIEDELLKKNRDLSKLTNMSLQLLESLEKKRLLQNIVDNAANLVGTDTSAIYIVKGDDLLLEVASPSLPEDFPDEFRKAKLVNHPHIKKVVDTSHTVIVQDIAKTRLTEEENIIVTTRHLGSLVYIPLFVQKKVEGVIILGTINRKHFFEQSDIDLFSTFSTIASMSLENSYLFENLLMTKEKAEESSRLKSAFLHNISHEIRTPLNAIIGFSGFLGQENLNQETRNEFINIISQNNQQLLSVIDDILNISHVEAGQLSIAESYVDLNELFQQLGAQYILEAQKKGLRFIISNPPVEICHIHTDQNKISRIIGNLLNNAFKFTHEGGVELGLYPREGGVEIYVSDTGIGIPFEEQDRIFERFYQVDRSISRIYGGLGLGLSICEAYSKLLGGKIDVKSVPGQGSRFTVYIPCRNTTTETVANNTQKNRGSRKTILIAEDEDTNYAFMKEVIAIEGYHEIRALNGQEALDICAGHTKIDLVLMDIRMPVKNGYEAAAEISCLRPHIPIIAQTAFGFSDHTNQKSKQHFRDYLTKPFTSDQLTAILHKYLK